MKLLYVAGIEHCGSTLTDYLLSRRANTVGLGEVQQFFSPSHMQAYIRKWTGAPDFRLCSCGSDWNDCEFWGPLRHLHGCSSDAPLATKYSALIAHARALYGDDSVIIDSSKHLAGLTFLADNRAALGFGSDDMAAVLAIKDVRSFSASLLAKSEVSNSYGSVYGIFKRWHFRNSQFLDFFRARDFPNCVSLYERLCAEPELLAGRVFELIGLPAEQAADVPVGRSHVVLGNKGFIGRFRGKITYDSRWYLDDRINLVYLLHRPSRRFNKALYSQQLLEASS
jgi:hypothetical protein